MNKTKIEWCDRTWNPVTGCYHSCEYCYARRIAERFGGFTGYEDPAGIYDNKADKVLHPGGFRPIHEVGGKLYPDFFVMDKKGDTRKAGFPFKFEPTIHWDRMEQPSNIREPCNIFVVSMGDLFGDWVPDAWIEAVFRACGAAPQHRYLFLTKNPARYATLANAGRLPVGGNMWYGTTATQKRQVRFDGNIRYNTFLSVEPLMERLDVGLGSFGNCGWIIIGAETGSRKGKVVPEREWIENIEEAAAITHIPVFMKDSLIPIVGDGNMRREVPWRC